MEEEEQQQHQNLGFGFLAIRGSLAALGRIASPSRSFRLTLFWILLFACYAFSSVKNKFNLIGLVSIFGTNAATKSLSYSALNDNWFYVTGHIGPGSLSVASVLFEAAGFCLARLLALGGAEDVYHVAQLVCPGGLRYVGLKSYSECPVGNAVGTSVVRENESLWTRKRRKETGGSTVLAKLGQATPELQATSELGQAELGQATPELEGGHAKKEAEVGRKFGRRMGRDAKREVKVVVLEVGRTKEDMRVLLKASKGGSLLLGWLPLLLTALVIGSACSCKDWFVAGLIALGTLGMMVAVLGLRFCLFKYFIPDVATGAPAGDCLVMDDEDADTLHIILGEEKSIQALFQHKIDYQASLGKYALFLAGSILYVYVVASVLYLPHVSASGQILFAMANVIGFVADMVKASIKGNLGLAKKAREQFEMAAKDLVVFRNRTAAVAFVARHAKDRTMLKSKKLLPCEGPVWQKWWEELAKCDGEGDDSCIISAVEEADDEHKILLETLLRDMMDGLKA